MDFLSVVLLCFVTMLPTFVSARTNPAPEIDPNFMQTSDGIDLSRIQVAGAALTLTRGTGVAISAQDRAAFNVLRSATSATPNHPVQWVLMDLDTHQVIGASRTPHLKQYGASVAKIFVSGTLLDLQRGRMSRSQLQLMSDMQVVSSNTAWYELQKQTGGGDDARGCAAIQSFTQRMGYPLTRAFRGFLNNLHGNELTAFELAEYLYDTYQNNYPGAELVWKLMHTFRTGRSRANRFLPNTQFVGGKTGTYDGATINPDTGKPTFPDGTPYTVHVRHQVLVFYLNGHEYGLAVLADTGTDDSAALLAGGLYDELLRGFDDKVPASL